MCFGIAIVLAARGRKHVWGYFFPCAVASVAPSVEHRVQLVIVGYLEIRRSAASPIRHHPNGGRLVHAQPLAQRLVGLHLIGELALRIDHKGQRDAVLLRELLCKRAQIVLGLDTDLVREDVVAPYSLPSFLGCVSNHRAFTAA